MSNPTPNPSPTPKPDPPDPPDSSETPFPFFGVCKRCPNRSVCRRPCPFVEAILSEGNPRALERNLGDDIRILFPYYLEIRETDLDGEDDRGRALRFRIFSDTQRQLFDDLNEAAAAESFQQIQARVFWGVLFEGFSFADMAVKLDIAESAVKSAYQTAKQRIIDVAAAMDRRDFGVLHGAELLKFPRWLHVYLLQTLLGMKGCEIQQLLGISKSVVTSLLAIAKKRVAAGNLNLADLVGPEGGAGLGVKNPKTGEEYYQEALDLVETGAVASWRQAAEVIAEREQIKSSSVRGKVNHFLRVAGIKRGERVGA